MSDPHSVDFEDMERAARKNVLGKPIDTPESDQQSSQDRMSRRAKQTWLRASNAPFGGIVI
jgi:hypothetical protein